MGDGQASGRLRRRTLLGAAAAAGLEASLRPTLGGLAAGADWLAGTAATARPLPIPEVLTGSDLTIPMRVAKLAILPGRRTEMWTYAGSFPGPTIRRPAGEPTTVRFQHRLPSSAGEMTVHLHGGHNRSSEDGQPGGLTTAQPASAYCDITPNLSAAESGNDLLIQPGGERVYTYDGIEHGVPERAAFQWYHDHRLDNTARNVWRGLAGMWITDDEFDAALPLPHGARDLPIMLADRSFNRRNQLTDPFGKRPPDDGVTGRAVLVNGAIRPYHRVAARRYRLRLLNASHFRSYNLHIEGVQMVQIATESGLMPKPLKRDRILIGPAERVEIVVDFARARGKRVRLLSSRRPGENGPGSKSWRGALMEFRVSDRRSTDDSRVPAALRPLPDWVATAPQTPSHTWRITLGGGFNPSWLINGRTYDPGYSDVSVPLDTTVTWQLHNKTGVPHLFHLHGTDWAVLKRNGQAPPAYERCLKETFLLDPGDRLLVAGRFSDFTGPYVVHCHMLDHEDHGLMSQFEVV